MTVRFRLDGDDVALDCDDDTRLTDILRERMERTETKIACSIGRCGACTVLMDGRAVNACLLMAYQLDGREIVTADGLESHPLGAAIRAGLAEENAFQCGYCAPGFSVALVALLSDNPRADEDAIRAGLEGNICRCTGYHSILRGALNAARRIRGEHPASGD